MQRIRPEALDTRRKAFDINLDPSVYGTLAEIGAGQEVARWFFRAGAAAGTVAKTISAYDMQVSDAIYGPTRRYVSRDRLRAMLEYEFALLVERLDGKRGATTRFFAYADTVMARSFTRREDSNGWLGIRFQREPRAEPSEVLIHVLMLDRENTQQQEALGVLGVNLVYGAFRYHDRPLELMESLTDGLSAERVEIDLIKLSGPAFADVDNRLMNLHLVERGMADATLFTTDGEAVQASELLHGRPVLVERGRFRPVTKVTRDMLECARRQFEEERPADRDGLVVLMEMTLRELAAGERVDRHDFLARVDMIGSLGKMVLVSNAFEYYRLAEYLFRYTRGRIGIVMGVPSLERLFDETYYADLGGGILESFGRMFKGDLKLYVHPRSDPAGGPPVTVETLRVPPRLRHLYAHLVESGRIVPLRGYREEYLPILADAVLAAIRSGEPGWEDQVPDEVAAMVKDRRLWGWSPPGR